MLILLICCALGGYLAGSVPFGLLLCYAAGYGDIRKIGSGNIGATNVLRTGNKTLALLTVLLDASKAGFAALLAYYLVPDLVFADGVWIARGEAVRTATGGLSLRVLAALVAGTFGVIGHNFPIWLKFKGGKGVASAFGLILMTAPKVGGIALLVWLIMAFLFRYSSLAAITAAVVVPIASIFLYSPVYTIFFSAIALLVLIRHRANIKRLLKGEESKISFSKKRTAEEK